MRAAFKALGDGKQVAVLAPTTVLAFQHFETFKRRFAAFPVRVEMFSRFRAAGDKDIETRVGRSGSFRESRHRHRDSQTPIQRRLVRRPGHPDRRRRATLVRAPLGTPEADAEQCTCAGHERHTHPSHPPHVAFGIRDMSVIETPPKDRLAIQTVVAAL